MGIKVDGLYVDLPGIVSWKDRIVQRLTGGVSFLCEKNGVEVVRGRAEFVTDRKLVVESEDDRVEIEFSSAIIATGSRPMELEGFPHDGTTVIGSTEALSLDEVPERFVVIGAGYIGLELGSVYAKLGSKVSIVEFLPELMPALDPEAASALARRLKKLKIDLHLEHSALRFEPGEPNKVIAQGPEKILEIEADVVMVGVGRVPNSDELGIGKIGIETDDRGFVKVDDRQQTNVAGIYAIGDVTGGALLAHKAYQEAKVAAEVIAGEPAAFDSVAIPAVVYTDPEIAWTGLSEREATEQGYNVVTGTFPFSASGRAMSLDSTDGFVKVIGDADTGRLLGVLAVGRGVSEFIGEGTLALEMGAFLEDVALTIHPHPTMSEAFQEAVEAALGKAVHMVNK